MISLSRHSRRTVLLALAATALTSATQAIAATLPASIDGAERTGARSWHLTPVPGTRRAAVLASVALPDGDPALLLLRSEGDELRYEETDRYSLEVQVRGRTRVISRKATGSLQYPTLAADAKGNLTAFWLGYSDGRNRQYGYLWEHGRVRRFSPGLEASSWAALAVAPDGSGLLAMADTVTGAHVLFARRPPHGTFGRLQRSPLRDLEALAATGGGGAALVGPVSVADSRSDQMSIQRSLTHSAPLSPPVALSTVDPRGVSGQRTALVMTSTGSIVAAYEQPIDQEAHTVVRGVIWPAAAARPIDLPDLSPTVTAGDPALFAAEDRVWAAWSETPAGDNWARSVAVTAITDAGAGPLWRLRTPTGVRLSEADGRPLLTGSGASGVRVSLSREPHGAGNGAIVRTVEVDAHGAFGPLERISPAWPAYPVAIAGSRTPVLAFTMHGKRRSSTRAAIARPS